LPVPEAQAVSSLLNPDHGRDQHQKEKTVAKDKKKDERKGKSRRQTARKGKTRKQQNRVQLFFRESIGELRKVSWPTRKEATNLTIVVLIVVFVMSSFLGILDAIYSQFFALLFGT
jgi:preprotein translocase subunit SecE